VVEEEEEEEETNLEAAAHLEDHDVDRRVNGSYSPRVKCGVR
jgi:hypothetical protein